MKFLNATQHLLTGAQIVAAELFGANHIYELKTVAPELFGKLANTPADIKQLDTLADAFVEVAAQFDFVHLPIGSPAFQFVLAQKFATAASNTDLIFSHSVRESVDEALPDGSIVKRAVFNFQSFVFVTDVPR